MKVCVLIMLITTGALAHEIAGIDANGTSNGACNVPARICTVFVSSPPVANETILIIASWAGQALTANVSDGVNRYRSISGPVNAPGGILRGQAWYVQNNGSPTGFKVTLSGPSIAGAFDGIFVQVVSLKALDRGDPLDPATVSSLTGTGTILSISPDNIGSPTEMMWAIFLTDAPGTPWTPSRAWTEISGGEAVSESEYKNVSQGKPEAAGAVASRSLNWIAFAFGFKTANPPP